MSISFVIDCGSDLTLIQKTIFKSLLPNLKLPDCNFEISDYGVKILWVK